MMDRFDKFFKQQSDKGLQEKAVLALLTESSYAKQLRLERDAERLEQQTLQLQKLEPLRKARDEELPRLKAAGVTAEEKTAKCKAALDEAEKKESRRHWTGMRDSLLLTRKSLVLNIVNGE